MGYYKEHCQNNDKISIKLLQEPDVISLLIDSNIVASEQEINGKIDDFKVGAGDSILRNTNVVMGFSWKTDLLGMTRDFPYGRIHSKRATERKSVSRLILIQLDMPMNRKNKSPGKKVK